LFLYKYTISFILTSYMWSQ